MIPAAHTCVKNASMSAWHCSRLNRLCIGTSPMSAARRGRRRDPQRVLVRPDALDRAHRPRPERAPGPIGDAEVHRYANERDIELAVGLASASGRNGKPRNVAGSANGHLRRSAPENICAATAANSGSWMSPPLASEYFWRRASSFLLSIQWLRGGGAGTDRLAHYTAKCRPGTEVGRRSPEGYFAAAYLKT
jgi:hypothetical protein